MDIVFVINRLALEGFGATLTSLIRSCSASAELRFWFLCSGLQDADKRNIDLLLQQEHYHGSTQYINFDAQQLFGHLQPLHGDWTPYGKLLIPSCVKVNTVLYLDADLVVLEDVLRLRQVDFAGAVLTAVHGSSVGRALDFPFLAQQLDWPAERPYFNSGVVFFNLKRWHELDMDQRWQALARAHGQRLTSHDQTLLNAICEGNAAQLPIAFNNPWYSGLEKPQISGHSILHFVGSPKPWDFTGRFIHSGYQTWRSLTPDFWYRLYHPMTLRKVYRTWQIKRSILKSSLRWWQKAIR